MKVEFLVDSEINDGRQIFISEPEFKKAIKSEEEFNSFAYATHCFFSFYGIDDFIHKDEYEVILKSLEKGGAVIISMEQIGYNRFCPDVYVSNNNRLKRIDLQS